MEQGKLGILGGMGPQATATFYQRILDRTAAASDQEHIPALILSDAGMPDRTAAILEGREEAVFRRLLAGARQLQDSGCTALAIPCNTAHYFADRLQAGLEIPIVHMVRETCSLLAARGCKRAAILATDGAVRTGIYQKECQAQGFEGIAPGGETQRRVMGLIYDEIKTGGTGSPETFAAIDRAVRAMGCDAAILGCTELSVYRAFHGLPDFYVDAMEVLVERCITACGGKLAADHGQLNLQPMDRQEQNN